MTHTLQTPGHTEVPQPTEPRRITLPIEIQWREGHEPQDFAIKNDLLREIAKPRQGD